MYIVWYHDCFLAFSFFIYQVNSAYFNSCLLFTFTELKEKKKIPKMLKAINKAKKTESFDREILYRLLFLVVILAVLAGGISLRIFQPRPWRNTCMPFANHTIVHNISSALCQEAILEGLASQAHPIAMAWLYASEYYCDFWLVQRLSEI